jgi:NADP-dependent 3-hydroxy acid dehydrogenase YdfG
LSKYEKENNTMRDVSNKVVMITGAAGNLGSATANAFKESGSQLILIDYDEDGLHKKFRDLEHSKDIFLSPSIDLTQSSQIEELIDELSQRFGRIDVLVNTAGGYRGGTSIRETPSETLSHMLNLNVHTTWNTSRAVLPIMLDQGSGSIVNVGARAGLKGVGQMGAYSLAKSGVMRITESSHHREFGGGGETEGNTSELCCSCHDRYTSKS